MDVCGRLRALRERMKECGAQWYLCTSEDPHGSEYVNAHYHDREYYSAFTGSAGTLLVGTEEALLWTDGRYFVQAEAELFGSGIRLMRMGDAGVPTLNDFLEEKLSEGEFLFLDGRRISASAGRELAAVVKAAGAKLRIGSDPAWDLWEERPADSAEEILVLPEELAGKSFGEKLSEYRDALAGAGAVGAVISALDEEMWLFNLRGRDVECNPVAYAYTVVTQYGVSLYVKEEAVTDELCAFAERECITLKPYADFYRDLPKLRFDGAVLLDPERINYLIFRMLQRSGIGIVEATSPILFAKAVKNESELARSEKVYLKDSAVLTRFLYRVKQRAGKEAMDEYTLAQELDGMRLAQEDCYELSFPTISAFGPNAAMMHYEATKEHSAAVSGDGFYLVDSGGQYEGGTTDVTRTLALGRIPDEQKREYTRVAAGMLALQNAVFLKGCSGRNLDILARGPVWELERDYKCGTGHGVGYMLNVHEGPAAIRWKKREESADTPLEAGMILSDEPGVYVEGSHGIRIENILKVVKRTENEDGEFMGFEPLTLVPVDTDALLPEALEPKEKAWLNAYHRLVREKLLPFMQGPEEQEWLVRVTEALE